MKILIAVPTFETIEPEVFKAIYNLRPAGHELHFDFVKGYDCACARNEIARMTQLGGYDYVLSLLVRIRSWQRDSQMRKAGV